MFMLVVTFVVSGTTALAFTGVLEDDRRENPVVALDVDVSDERVVVRQEHGDAVDVDALELVVHREGGVERIPFTVFVDDRREALTAGESVVRNEGLPPDALELRVVFDGETVLYEQRVANR
jgi:hypothetical protein